MADIRYAKPGDKPIRSASAFNAMLDAARANRRTDNVDLNVVRVTRDPSVLQVVNNAQYATDLPRFAIVGIDDPVFVPIDNLGAEQTLIDQTCMSITWPATDAYRGRFAVLLEPLAIDGVGTARLCDTQICFVESYASVGDTVDIEESSRPDENTLSIVTGGIGTVLWAGAARDGSYLFTSVSDVGSPTGFSWVLDSSDSYITPTVAAVTLLVGQPANGDATHTGTGSVAPPASQWALIRFGGGGGGSGAEIIYFRTTGFCYGITVGKGCNCLEAVVTRVLCTSVVQVNDGIQVWDPDRCWFNIPSDLLIGRVGRATLFKRGFDLGGAFCTETIVPPECMWIVDSLCCGEEEYAA